jgi:hypothetical protein
MLISRILYSVRKRERKKEKRLLLSLFKNGTLSKALAATSKNARFNFSQRIKPVK